MSRGKNALKIQYCSKAIATIDIELTLLEKRFSHPERFVTKPSFKSDLYIVPKPKGLGIVGFAEIVEGIHLSGEVLGSDGKPAFKSQISNIFEQAFNFSFGSISDKTSEIYKRKSFNRTKALDFLRNLIIRKEKEDKNKKDEK